MTLTYLTKISNIFFSLFFLLGLIFLGWRTIGQLLKEKPEALKQLKIEDFKNSVQVFNNDFETAAGKDEKVLHPLATAKYHLFNNAITRKIIPGKDGWLFLWEETEQIDAMKQVLGKTRLPEKEVKKWRVYTDQRRAYVEARGIEYIKIIAPNKASIYPEYLAGELEASEYTFTDQLLDDLTQHTSVRLIDLRAVLLAAKNSGRLYYKTDTHWNNRGAFYAAQHIMAELKKLDYPVQDLTVEDFTWRNLDKAGGDAARLMMMQEELRRDYLAFEAKNGFELINEDSLNQRYHYLSPFISSCKKGTMPKTILFHDSFATNLRLFLGYHFEKLYSFWLWGAFSEDVVEQEKPSIVLDEVVERRLVETQHMNSATLINAYWEARFDDLLDFGKEQDAYSFEDLSKRLNDLVLENDKLLIVQLELSAAKAQKIKLKQNDVVVPYSLTAGDNKIYLQLDPEQDIQILSDSSVAPILKAVQLKIY